MAILRNVVGGSATTMAAVVTAAVLLLGALTPTVRAAAGCDDPLLCGPTDAPELGAAVDPVSPEPIPTPVPQAFQDLFDDVLSPDAAVLFGSRIQTARNFTWCANQGEVGPPYKLRIQL
jgi:hypothetical protein